MQPAIIFFDEIDGLAPVRSSKQDQIHSSIVSTLLALMDGLDSRGQVIVIGATNRVDSIDPAAASSRRFDRELNFALPSVTARKDILKIHTKHWSPPMSDAFASQIAAKTVGYCGADIKALCTESALRAVRRAYPQIYVSQEKLLIDVNTIRIKYVDFMAAMNGIVPASQRSAIVYARALPNAIAHLLQQAYDNIKLLISRRIPTDGTKQKRACADQSIIIYDDDVDEAMAPTEDEKQPSTLSPQNLSILRFCRSRARLLVHGASEWVRLISVPPSFHLSNNFRFIH